MGSRQSLQKRGLEPIWGFPGCCFSYRCTGPFPGGPGTTQTSWVCSYQARKMEVPGGTWGLPGKDNLKGRTVGHSSFGSRLRSSSPGSVALLNGTGTPVPLCRAEGQASPRQHLCCTWTLGSFSQSCLGPVSPVSTMLAGMKSVSLPGGHVTHPNTEEATDWRHFP